MQILHPQERKLFHTLGSKKRAGQVGRAINFQALDMQDMQILHPQERKLARKARGSADYHLATESDAGVAAVWRWLPQYGGRRRLEGPFLQLADAPAWQPCSTPHLSRCQCSARLYNACGMHTGLLMLTWGSQLS